MHRSEGFIKHSEVYLEKNFQDMFYHSFFFFSQYN